MSVMLDRQFLGYVSSQLERFKPVSSTTWVFKCRFCDGSTSSPNKLTAYWITRDTGLFYYCHCCQTNYPMWKYLKETDPHQYNEYQKQNYMENAGNHKSAGVKTVRKTHLDLKLDTPEVPDIVGNRSETTTIANENPTNAYISILKGSPFIPLDGLPYDHITKLYLRSRMIPETQWHRLAYIPVMGDIAKFHPDYKNLKRSKEARLVIPLINKDMKLVGATCRALDGNSQRYVELKFSLDDPMVFGMELIKNEETKYVFEGCMDSMLLGNSIGIGGLALGKVGTLGFDKQSTILIPDNQRKHNNVVSAIDKMLNAGYKVCMLSQKYYGKDFNDMVISGEVAIGDIKEIIDNNSYQGLSGKLFFSKWRGV